MNSKKKAILDRINHFEDAITKGREYLESGEHAQWHGFRPCLLQPKCAATNKGDRCMDLKAFVLFRDGHRCRQCGTRVTHETSEADHTDQSSLTSLSVGSLKADERESHSRADAYRQVRADDGDE